MKSIIMAEPNSALNTFDLNGLCRNEHFEKCHSLLGNFLNAPLHFTKNSQISQRGYTPLDSPMAKCRHKKNSRLLTLKIFDQWVTLCFTY